MQLFKSCLNFCIRLKWRHQLLCNKSPLKLDTSKNNSDLFPGSFYGSGIQEYQLGSSHSGYLVKLESDIGWGAIWRLDWDGMVAHLRVWQVGTAVSRVFCCLPHGFLHRATECPSSMVAGFPCDVWFKRSRLKQKCLSLSSLGRNILPPHSIGHTVNSNSAFEGQSRGVNAKGVKNESLGASSGCYHSGPLLTLIFHKPLPTLTLSLLGYVGPSQMLNRY